VWVNEACEKPFAGRASALAASAAPAPGIQWLKPGVKFTGTESPSEKESFTNSI